MSLGENLKRLRVERGLNQGQLGDLCGFTGANISHFEVGNREPTLPNLKKLRKGLGCSYDQLLVDSKTTGA